MARAGCHQRNGQTIHGGGAKGQERAADYHINGVYLALSLLREDRYLAVMQSGRWEHDGQWHGGVVGNRLQMPVL